MMLYCVVFERMRLIAATAISVIDKKPCVIIRLPADLLYSETAEWIRPIWHIGLAYPTPCYKEILVCPKITVLPLEPILKLLT